MKREKVREGGIPKATPRFGLRTTVSDVASSPSMCHLSTITESGFRTNHQSQVTSHLFLLTVHCSLLTLLLSAALMAAPVEHWMERGNKFYEQAQYDSAAVYYEKIVESGMNSSAAYYNLGNAYFRLQKSGPALLYYEKAHRLAPNDPDIIANIKYANVNIQDRVVAPEKGFFESVAWRLHTLFDLSTQLWLLFSGLCVLSAFLAIGLFASRNARLWVIYLSVIAGGMSVLIGISAGYKIYQAEKSPEAIVLASSVDARSEPNGAKILFTVHEGTKFRIRKSLDQWSLVSLPNGVSGWVENAALGRI